MIVFTIISCSDSHDTSYKPNCLIYNTSDTLDLSSEFGFVTITSLASSQGLLFVLDGPGVQVTVIDSLDRVQNSFGSEGNGPGEMSWPDAICALSDSTILISDFTGIHSYNSEGLWLGNIIEYLNNPMMWLNPVNNSNFIAYKHNIYMHNRQTYFDWTLSMYNLDGNRNCVFLTDTFAVDLLNATEILNRSLFSFRSAAGHDRIFLFDRNSQDYTISCRNQDNDTLYSIVRNDVTTVNKSSVEVEIESESVESWLRDWGTSNIMEYEYDPRPWREPVRDMWVTEDGLQLWVQRGDLEGFFFDIYATDDGTLLRTAEVLLDTTGLCEVEFFVADSNRIYAILETRDFEQLLVSFDKAP